MRIYPSHLPEVPMEPNPEDFRIIDVDPLRGQGIVALRSFLKGEILFQMNGHLIDEITQYSLQLGPNLHLDDPYFAGKVLHSCAPNSRLDTESRLFIAERDILSGDLLTMDYERTEDVMFRTFYCQCGAIDCRGEIVGRLARQQLSGTHGHMFNPAGSKELGTVP